jgi:hypothetical protein
MRKELGKTHLSDQFANDNIQDFVRWFSAWSSIDDILDSIEATVIIAQAGAGGLRS